MTTADAAANTIAPPSTFLLLLLTANTDTNKNTNTQIINNTNAMEYIHEVAVRVCGVEVNHFRAMRIPRVLRDNGL